MTAREYMAGKLKEFRKARGMSVDDVGSAVGKSGKTISAWEVCRGQPDADMLLALCRLYGVRISDFYMPDEGEEVMNEDELRLIDMYRSANEQGRVSIMAVADASSRMAK